MLFSVCQNGLALFTWIKTRWDGYYKVVRYDRVLVLYLYIVTGFNQIVSFAIRLVWLRNLKDNFCIVHALCIIIFTYCILYKMANILQTTFSNKFFNEMFYESNVTERCPCGLKIIQHCFRWLIGNEPTIPWTKDDPVHHFTQFIYASSDFNELQLSIPIWHLHFHFGHPIWK